MYLARNKNGRVVMSFVKPTRLINGDDGEWVIGEKKAITPLNRGDFLTYQIILLPSSEDKFKDLTWEHEPIEVEFFIKD